jgi:hypothetical protein
MRKVLLLMLAATLAGCITASGRYKQFEATAIAYERAIRWSDFRAALAIASNPTAPMPDLARLQKIRVTSYDVIGVPSFDEDTVKAVQLVEIRYVYIDSMSERTINDPQTWEYSEKDERWKLTSPFPPFR